MRRHLLGFYGTSVVGCEFGFGGLITYVELAMSIEWDITGNLT